MARKKRKPIQVTIRWMIHRDYPAVLEIDRDCFWDAWTEADLAEALQGVGAIGQVAEGPDGTILGYVVYELAKYRIRVSRLAVLRSHRRRGVGRQFVEKLVSKLDHARRERIVATCHERDLDAQRFFRGTSFRAVRVIRDHYEKDGDGYVFRRWLKECKRCHAACASANSSVCHPCIDKLDYELRQAAREKGLTL